MKLIVILIVAIMAILIAPKVTHQGEVKLDRVQTDAKQTFPYNKLIARAWFVEAVNIN